MPLDLPDTSSTNRHQRRRVIAAIATAAVAVIAGTGIAFARSDDPSGFRTAVVGEHAVDQILTGVATIQPVSQATVAFPSAGTVATVAVKPGDAVTTGAELASLDPTTLQQAVNTAQADLAQAELTVERAENGESTGGTGGGSSGSSNFAQPTSYDTGESSTTVEFMADTLNDQLTAARQAVADAQKQVDADLAAADQAMTAATTACANLTGSGQTQQATTSTTTPSSDSDGVNACYDALGAVQAAQQQLHTSQNTLAQASSHLDTLLSQQTPSSGSGSSSGTPSGSGGPSSSNTTHQGGTGTPTGSTSSAASSGPTSADLIADQKAVDAANDQLAAAQQALLQASIVSPIDGTVVSVNLAVGDTVSAGSSIANIVIAGPGGYEAVTMVKVTDLPNLKVGQAAAVEPDGLGRTITGKVIAIGLVSTSGASGTTYPVTISLTGDTTGLMNGTVATTTITTSSTATGLAVPTSAIHANNGRYTVTLLDNGTAKTATVQIGAIGSTWTAVTSGLAAGQTVALADLSQALPSSATSSTNGQTTTNRFGGTGGGNFGRTGGGGFNAPN